MKIYAYAIERGGNESDAIRDQIANLEGAPTAGLWLVEPGKLVKLPA